MNKSSGGDRCRHGRGLSCHSWCDYMLTKDHGTSNALTLWMDIFAWVAFEKNHLSRLVLTCCSLCDLRNRTLTLNLVHVTLTLTRHKTLYSRLNWHWEQPFGNPHTSPPAIKWLMFRKVGAPEIRKKGERERRRKRLVNRRRSAEDIYR